jgi:hypothetical protein
MRKVGLFVVVAVSCLVALGAVAPQMQPSAEDLKQDGPAYTSSGDLKMPDYRRWIFLTSGIDMNYQPIKSPPGHSIFQNVFVNPRSYEEFLKTGTWPDKTEFMLEIRAADLPISINKNGQTQAKKVIAQEVHVKDARLEGGWAFFNMEPSGTGKLISRPADCYQCHEAHAAVDTTFVQFYPTLIDIARSKGTFSPAYLNDEKNPAGSR